MRVSWAALCSCTDSFCEAWENRKEPLQCEELVISSLLQRLQAPMWGTRCSQQIKKNYMKDDLSIVSRCYYEQVLCLPSTAFCLFPGKHGKRITELSWSFGGSFLRLSLIKWVASLPMADSWNNVLFKVLSSLSHSVILFCDSILWFYSIQLYLLFQN